MRPFRLLFVLLPVTGLAQIRDWRIDSAHSGAHFSVRHMMVSNVRGQLGKITGTIKYDPADARTATVEARIDVAGIDTREPKRDAHLRSPDFFDVEKFPAITFRSKRVEPGASGAWLLSSRLSDISGRRCRHPGGEFTLPGGTSGRTGPAGSRRRGRGAGRSLLGQVDISAIMGFRR